MDLTYSLDTLLILCAAITCLSLGFKHVSLLAQNCERSVKAQDDITPVERCGGAEEPPRPLLLHLGSNQHRAVPLHRYS